jgi:lysozyme family protein
VTVETLIDEIIEREKGFVDHPNDKGGPTKWGITKATLQAWRGRHVTREDVRNLDQPEARDIYRAKFVSASGFGQLPDMLRSHVVDFGVTTPHYLVVKALQRALNPLPAEGKPDVVVVDGILGAKTLAAVQEREVRALTVRFCQERCRFYSRLAALSPTQLDFMDGWLNRVFGMWPE